MKIILHNLKVAFRNLMKYKLQTLISVLSIAIGILTLSVAHSILDNKRLPAIYDQPYYDRTYNLTFKSINDGEDAKINLEIIRALKRDGGLKSAEQIAVPNTGMSMINTQFQLTDSTLRKGLITAEFIDPEYLSLAGFQSAITGEKLTGLKKGEAIIGEDLAKQIFNDKNPIGSIQEKTDMVQPIPVRIVDVYRHMPSFNVMSSQDEMLFCLTDNIEDQELDFFFLTPWINVVRKIDCSEKQLIEEVNQRLLPLGIKSELKRSLSDEEIKSHIAMQTLIYVISSLILLAAIIGFLRIQIQLFHIRRGELTLRIVNGARRLELFGMLATEPAISICLAVAIAILLGYPLQEFLNSLDLFFIKISNLWLYSIIIGAGLMVLTCLSLWFALQYICSLRRDIISNLRHGRNHLSRYMMLGFQIIVSMIFVSGTLILIDMGNKAMKLCNLPENEDHYKEALALRRDYTIENWETLLEKVKHLPELERIVLFSAMNISEVKEIKENPELLEKLNGKPNAKQYCTNDPTLPSYFGMEVDWLPGDFDRNECILIGENFIMNGTKPEF